MEVPEPAARRTLSERARTVRRGRPAVGLCSLRNAYLAIGSVLIALFLLVPPFQGSGVLLACMSGSSSVAILVGVRRNRPQMAWPWLVFAFAQALYCLGDVHTLVFPLLTGREMPFPSIGDGLFLATYPVMMIGILLIVRARTARADRAALIDSLIITIGIGLLSWVFLIAPYVTDATLGPFAKIVSIAYPIGDILLLSAILLLVFDGGRRQSAFFLLVAAGSTLFIADAAYGFALLNGTYHQQLIYDAGLAGYYLLWGSAALDRTMRDLTEVTPRPERHVSDRRLAILTVAAVLAPGIEIVRKFGSGELDLLVVLSASVVLLLLVILRVVGLARSHERAVQRERSLRASSAALVAAGTPEDVATISRAGADELIGERGEVRICSDHPTGFVRVVIGSEVEPLADATVEQLEAAASAPGGFGALDAAARADLLVSPLAGLVTVFPVEGLSRRALIIVASIEPISAKVCQALRVLADAASLALGSAHAAEEAHRLGSEARLGSLVRNASDLITVVDLDGTVTYQSPSIERILGYAADHVVGRPIFDLEAPSDRGRLGQVLAARTQGGAETHTFECTLAHADGHSIEFEVLATDLVDDEHVRGIVLNGRDVSERRAFEAQIAHQTFHDPVTGLPNRALFSDRVQHALTRADRGREAVGVIFLDIDDFKTVNDSLGHPAGDEVLREVGRRILATISSTDTAARFGGDEFAVLVEGVTGPQAVADVADRIVASFSGPVQLEVQQVVVRPSLGIAVSAPDPEASTITAEHLVRNADAAMYICKRDGKGGYRVFEEAMHARVLERLMLRAELEQAIELNQFELYFQPLVDLQTGAASGVEALCRWNHPVRGLVQPDQFIPLAEESGLIVEIGRWVLQEGCRRAVGFQASLPSAVPLKLGVNLSVRQLQHPEVVADVRRALMRSGLDPRTLVLEVTESVMMADADLAAVRLHQLRALGASIAMDDFGTGYSSLSYLSRFPIDIIKMDRSFLSPDARVDPSGLAAAIVSLGATLGLEVVAEGIERPDQMEALRALGCQTGQGYLIGRPMDADATWRWLRDRRALVSGSLVLAA